MEQVDLVIVGAGISGLTNASTYHHLYPNAKILILEAAPSIGGPWASDRTFPGLKTNNLLGMYEHPDFPMEEKKLGIKKGEHVPAKKMLEYLEALVKESGIGKFLRLNTKVDLVEKTGDDWLLHCVSSLSGEPHTITTPKLIIAVGNTNKPKMPKYPTSSAFEPPVLHSKEFPAHVSSVAKADSHTLVVGGGKSAWDVAYACATQPDSTSTLLIRPSGNGPAWMTPSHVTPFTLWLEKLVFTRFFGFMSPCPWAQTTGIEGWLRSFLHSTWLGRKIVGAFWKILGDDAISLNKLKEHPETAKLVPWRGAFEVGSSLSIHNYPTNFFELVREGRIRVVIDEIESFEAGRDVLLKSGARLQVDTVVCATGWEVGHAVKFAPDAVERELGLPTNQNLSPNEVDLINQTERELFDRYPFLDRDTSRNYHPDSSLRHAQSIKTTQQPHRLYRFMVPPALLQDRSIVFAGALYCLGAFPLAYIQSLWIAAFFDDKLALPSTDVLRETYRDTQYFVLRNATGYGKVSPDLVFDSLPHFDVLLRDLGLQARRKGSELAEVWKSYGPEDYKGLLEEWMEKEKAVREGKKDI